jgi:type VI secretion system secreted protein Hcp
MPNHVKELSANASATSDSDIFLDVQARRAGKIKGEVATADYADDIQLMSWRWGVSAGSAIGSTAATSRRQYRALVVTKGVDAASTGLLTALVSNDELKEVNLVMRKAGGEALPYLKMQLGGGRVVDVDLDVDHTGRPIERVTIQYTKIEIDYQSQQADGSGGAGYSFCDDVMSTS